MLATEIKYAEEKVKNELSSFSKAILKTLLYFDIFQCPLTVEEICTYCSCSTSMEEVSKQLEALVEVNCLKRSGVYYFIDEKDSATRIKKKIEGNGKAEELLKIANRFSRFISYFPFVRGICLSGSLSKGYADGKSDIDYFIITEPGRLWLCRTLLIAFKKIFLLNSHKYFCVNYFVDTDNLEIPDKNTFTAIELTSVIPTYNCILYEQLMARNRWTDKYCPNFSLKNVEQIPVENRSVIKRITEKLLSGKMGDRLDERFFHLTLSQWRRKFKDFDEAQFDLRLRSRKNVSKHHPLGFQEKVLKSLEGKIRDFENKFRKNLS
jgi:hypothetical protein